MTMKLKSPHALLSAYQCGPGMGSVSQIGWEWYSRLAQRIPVTLVTHVRNQPSLSRAGAPLSGSKVIYIDTEWFARPLYRTAKKLFPRSEHAVFLLSSLDYFVFDSKSLSILQRVRRKYDWDLVHAVTPVSPAASSGLHRLGLPFIVGPWNGGLLSPSQFPGLMQQDSAWVYRLRELGKLSNLYRRTTERTSFILSANRATDLRVPQRHRGRCLRMCENGADLDRFQPSPWPSEPSAKVPLNLLFVGRLIPSKGLPYLLKAIAMVKRQTPVRLRVVGEGPLRDAWRQTARDLGLAGAVQFLGSQTHEQIAAHLQWAHALCLPSVRESGGAVLLEAMAAARPVIAVDYGGPAELVTPSVGELIPADGPEAVIEGFRQALLSILREPGKWRAQGVAGRKRVRCFSWDAKIDRAVQLYESLTRTSVKRAA